MARLLYCVLLLIVMPGVSRAQRLLFQHLGTDRGLIQSDINHITQDTKGNIWIGTNAGISVFDGKKFTNYDDIQKLSSLRINNIVCDHKGVMWIATDNSVLKFDKNFTIAFKPETTVPYLRVFQLAVDRDNNKYFIYNRETYKISDSSDKPVKHSLNIPSRSPVTVLSIDPHNNFWVATANGEAYKLTSGGAVRLKPRPFIGRFVGTTPINFFAIRHNNNITSFTTSRGIFHVREDSLINVRDVYSGIPDRARLNCSMETLQGSEWIGSDSGVFKISADSTLKQFTKINGFTNNSVSCIFEDSEKNLWYGTYGNGLYQLSTESISLYDEVGDIDLSNIEAIQKTEMGDIIFRSYFQGVIRMRNQKFVKNPFTNKPVFVRYVTGIAAKGRYTFVGTFGQGIFELDNHTSSMKPANLDVQEHFINALLPYKQGFLIFGGSRALYSFDNNYNLLMKKDMPGLSSLFEITDSTLLLIQNGQIDIYDRYLNLFKKNLFTEIHARLSCIEFYRNYILCGTIGEGLFLYDKEYRFIKKIPSRSNIIYALKISRDNLFIGSNVGLSKIPVAGLERLKQSEEKIIFNGECKEEGIFPLNADSVIVASSRGLFVINTTMEDFNFTKPILTVQSIRFKNNSDQVASDFTDSIARSTNSLLLNIPYNKNELQVSLKGISQSSPGFLRYQFVLENYEDKWNTTDNGELIRYTNLPPGNYVFKARLYAKGNASPTVSIPFTIDEPIQATWWFQVLVFLLFTAFAILLLKIFNRLNHRYVQTKWINKSTNELQTKKTLIGQLVKTTKTDLQVFKEYLLPQKKQNGEESERYLEFYFKTTLNRLDLLWEKDFMNLRQLNEALKTFTQSSFDTMVDISHTSSNEAVLIPSEKAEKIIRLFSLFIFYSMETNQARQFALTSKLRLGNQLFLKIYSTETLKNSTKNSIHRHLENCIRELNKNDFSIEFIESQNLGNMIILSMNLEAGHAIKTNSINQSMDE